MTGSSSVVRSGALCPRSLVSASPRTRRAAPRFYAAGDTRRSSVAEKNKTKPRKCVIAKKPDGVFSKTRKAKPLWGSNESSSLFLRGKMNVLWGRCAMGGRRRCCTPDTRWGTFSSKASCVQLSTRRPHNAGHTVSPMSCPQRLHVSSPERIVSRRSRHLPRSHLRVSAVCHRLRFELPALLAPHLEVGRSGCSGVGASSRVDAPPPPPSAREGLTDREFACGHPAPPRVPRSSYPFSPPEGWLGALQPHARAPPPPPTFHPLPSLSFFISVRIQVLFCPTSKARNHYEYSTIV